MGRRLEIPVIDIFSKFFLHVVEGASPTQSDENERVVFKKLNHFAKFTFSSNVDLLLHQGFHARTCLWIAHGRTESDGEDPKPDSECLEAVLSNALCWRLLVQFLGELWHDTFTNLA